MDGNDDDADYFYELSKNDEITQSHENLSLVFRKVHEKHGPYFLSLCIYSWLDGWSDNWTLSREKMNVRIMGQPVVRKLFDNPNKIRQTFRIILPLLGELPLHPFYKSQIVEEFELINW